MKKLSFVLTSILLGLGLLAGVAYAAQDNTSTTVAKGETYIGLFHTANQDVLIDGTVTGDVWAAGSNVTINGTVEGSVYAAGEVVEIDGNVRGNVMAAGSKVTIKGHVDGSVYLAGSELKLAEPGQVNGSMVAFGSQYYQAGSVGTQAYIFGSQVKVNGKIGGNTKIYASEIKIGDKAAIGGNLAYVNDAKVSIANDKNIAGSITKITDMVKTKNQPSAAGILFGALFGLVAALLLGLVAFSIVPATTRATAVWERQNLAKAVLYGVGFAFVTPIVLLLLLLSFVGYQLALVGILIYLAILMLGGVMSAYCIGQWLLKRDKFSFGGLLLELLTGLAVLTAVGLVPFVGALVGFFAAIAGIGAIMGRSKQRLAVVRSKQLAKT